MKRGDSQCGVAGPRRGRRVSLRTLSPRDAEEFLALVRRSRQLHRPWSYPPASPEAFHAYVARSRQPTHRGYLICLRSTGAIVGVANLMEIVRGVFQGTYLGYYAFHPYNGQGYMHAGVTLVLARAFDALRLHRVEANIQSGNDRSLRLAQSLGFHKEGFSPRYLKIGGRWRDHERWALLAEDWRRQRSASRSRDDQRARRPLTVPPDSVI